MILFWFLGSITPEFKKPEQEKKIKVSLKEFPHKKIPAVVPENKQLPPEIAPPMPKGEQLKEITKLPPVEYKPEAKPKKPKLNKKPVVKKPEPKVEKVKPLPAKTEHIVIKEEKIPEKTVEEKSEDPLAWMSEDLSHQEKKKKKVVSRSGASAGKDIKKLYGVDWNKLSPGEQKYILDNKEIMRRITQEVLTRQARVSDLSDLNVNRVNIIEFYLHPNGDMSDFKFLDKSGYFILDDITKATIEYAYSKYPRPEQKTLIRYNVYYNLKHY